MKIFDLDNLYKDIKINYLYLKNDNINKWDLWIYKSVMIKNKK